MKFNTYCMNQTCWYKSSKFSNKVKFSEISFSGLQKKGN